MFLHGSVPICISTEEWYVMSYVSIIRKKLSIEIKHKVNCSIQFQLISWRSRDVLSFQQHLAAGSADMANLTCRRIQIEKWCIASFKTDFSYFSGKIGISVLKKNWLSNNWKNGKIDAKLSLTFHRNFFYQEIFCSSFRGFWEKITSFCSSETPPDMI